MNYYSFKSENVETDEFLHWLRENFGRRFRLIQSTPRAVRPLRVRRRLVRVRRFHSQVLCVEGGWTKCWDSKANFHKLDRYNDDLRVRTFDTRFDGYSIEPSPIHIVFDSPADMVLCKLRWHGM